MSNCPQNYSMALRFIYFCQVHRKAVIPSTACSHRLLWQPQAELCQHTQTSRFVPGFYFVLQHKHSDLAKAPSKLHTLSLQSKRQFCLQVLTWAEDERRNRGRAERWSCSQEHHWAQASCAWSPWLLQHPAAPCINPGQPLSAGSHLRMEMPPFSSSFK